ncbi:hypothetical protein [Micromonospora coxensis]|uniref:hypothetical protein n=1 Tax=Micromonospora coxensis TaxID=356852 RepID=UPI0018D4FB71|nr:hypothetical protein [Micromonospora coxensis]
MIRHYHPGVFHVARELFDELRQYSGSAAFRDVLVPWTEKRGQMIVELLAPLARYGDWRREEYRWADPLEQAYALSRVNDVLLLGFQPALPVGAELPWAHDLHMGIQWPTVTLGEYRSFFTDLAMTLVDEPDFDPFLHEIVAVEPADDPGHPVEIVESLWPAVMHGELLFSRSGVRVRGGAQHVVAGIADRAPLDDVFLRRYRDTYDASLGWGHNSQWKTDFRRDYRTPTADHLNVDGELDIDKESGLDPELKSAIRDVIRDRYACPQAETRIGERNDVLASDYRVTLPRNRSSADTGRKTTSAVTTGPPTRRSA